MTSPLGAQEYDAFKRAAWAGQAQAYAETFALLCAHVVEPLLDLAATDHGPERGTLLDVGTGTGAVAAAALRRGYRVVAVDPDPDMRHLASTAAAHAEVLAGELPRLPFTSDSFDVVTANFVINQVGDPRAAIRELERVARPGGRVAVSVWPRPAAELQRLWDEVIAAAGVDVVAAPRVEPGLDFERSTQGLAGLLDETGLVDITAENRDFIHRVDPDLWWSGPARGVTSVGAIVAAQDGPTRERLAVEYRRLSARYLRPDGLLALPTSAVLAVGTVSGR